MVKHLPHISIEKYAAYLDGNLPDEEMKQMKTFIDTDADMQAVLEADSNIGADLDLDLLENEPIPFDFELASIKLPTLNTGLALEQNVFFDELFSSDSDRYGEEMVSIINETDQDNNSQNNIIMAKNTEYKTYGEQGENIKDLNILQPDDHSCALRAQQIILRDYGIDIPFEDLEQIAKNAGYYSDSGTYQHDMGKVLEMAGVGMHQIEGGTVYDLTNELAQGHRIIVSVDADELWYNDKFKDKISNWISDRFGTQAGNHALIVAGVEVNPDNPNDVKVVLTDSGAGDLRVEYPLDQFMDAWQDSNYFMVATDVPAPYQYDASTGMEVPSNFASQVYFNQFVEEHSYQLNDDCIISPQGYQPAFKGHLDTISDVKYEDFRSKYDLLQGAKSDAVMQSTNIPGMITALVNDIKSLFGHHTEPKPEEYHTGTNPHDEEPYPDDDLPDEGIHPFENNFDHPDHAGPYTDGFDGIDLY